MKRIYNILAVAAVMVAALTGCKEDNLFPDPGFDLITDKTITVRRDTCERFNLELNVNAPGGVDVIQILNGRTLGVLEELDQYRGKKSFRFSYEVNLSGIDKQKDSVLMYNVRIITQDNRGFNSSFRIDLKKLSFPEITLPNNDIIGTTVPVVGIQGLVSTGIYTIKSIRIFVADEERYSVPDDQIEGLSEYRLSANVSYNFEKGKQYPLRIEIRDQRDEVHNEYLTVKGVAPKRANAILSSTDGTPAGRWDLRYDDRDRISEIEYTDFKTPSRSCIFRPNYNADGLVDRVEYGFLNNANYYRVDFTYEQGRPVKMQHTRHNRESGQQVNLYETLQNFVYRPDGTIKAFDIDITTVDDLQYADGFFEGEKIFAERWDNMMIYYAAGSRRKKTGFVPVLNPAYIEGMPPLWYPGTFINIPPDLFWYKYIYTADQPGPNNTESPSTYFSEYTYTTSADGQLESFTRKQLVNAWWHTYQFIYDEQ